MTLTPTYILATVDERINSVQFRIGGPQGKLYTYLTREVATIGDLFVVPVKDGFGIFKVEGFDAPAKLEQNPGYDYKWAIQKVDLAAWNQLNEQTERFVGEIRKMQRKKAREAVRAQLEEHFGTNVSEMRMLLDDVIEADTTKSDA